MEQLLRKIFLAFFLLLPFLSGCAGLGGTEVPNPRSPEAPRGAIPPKEPSPSSTSTPPCRTNPSLEQEHDRQRREEFHECIYLTPIPKDSNRTLEEGEIEEEADPEEQD